MRRTEQTDALTQVFKDALLCLAIVLLICLGSKLDKTNQAEEELAAQRHAERMQAVREAYQQGLDEGAERELFRQQQFLAQIEGRP